METGLEEEEEEEGGGGRVAVARGASAMPHDLSEALAGK